ncbi:hypothetical protein BHE74_00052572 [Ensete ventricosum]|nr:hypothetical protein BHE74_00052572 [Ensete ventricosum]
MKPRSANSRQAIDSCTLLLHAWKPFQLQTLVAADPPQSYPFRAKKPCLSDRSTAPSPAAAVGLDVSRFSLIDDPPPPRPPRREEGLRWFARKRRLRSISGRSSDRSGTRPRGGVSATYATCSDFPLAAGGTDSSGEFFAIGDWSWGSDASEAARVTRREGREVAVGVRLERESPGFGGIPGVGGAGMLESQGNESGYGSEAGYRGDGELGYENEIEDEDDDDDDDDDDDGKQLFWGEELGGMNPKTTFYPILG